jgi:hypothetical protein
VGKKNGNLSRGERLQIMLSPEELSVVDDFRFKQKALAADMAALSTIRVS